MHAQIAHAALPVGETGGSRGQGARAEGDRPACTSLKDLPPRQPSEARKVGETARAAPRRFTLAAARGGAPSRPMGKRRALGNRLGEAIDAVAANPPGAL